MTRTVCRTSSKAVGFSLDFRSGRHRQVFFCGSSSEGDRRPNIFGCQAGKIYQNFLDAISLSQAGKDRAKRNSRAPKDGFAAADLRIANDAFVEELWHSIWDYNVNRDYNEQ